ncbi:MAG TPA: hypothetical protein ENJ09_09160, partial [Planctomycetes bacterium]|nr:hypothetical protein [Planctomycetota bacterium]
MASALLAAAFASCASAPREQAVESAPSPAPPLSGTPGGARVETGAPEGAGEVGESEAEGAGGKPLGWVAGMPIRAEDLLLTWHQDASQEVFLVVEKVVSTRLALAEAQRLGMRLDPEEVELEVTRARQAIAAELAASDLDLTLEEFVESRLGMRSDVYFERLRLATIRRMLTERAVRCFTLANDWARVRMIVVATRGEADALRARIEAGEDVAALAREASLDASADDGGLIPFLL